VPNRILRDWTDSFAVNELDAQEERFFVRLIMKADDYGRFHADPRLLKANLFPLLPDIRETDISRWTAACEKAGLIRCYVDAKSRRFLEIQNFQQRMRQKTASRFPAPDKPKPDSSLPDDGHTADTRPSRSGLSPVNAIKPQNDRHATVTRPLEAEAYSEAEAEATRERANASSSGNPLDDFHDPLAEMADVVAKAVGEPCVPAGDSAAPFHELAQVCVDIGATAADVADYESDYYRRKAKQGSNYPLTLQILRADLPGFVRGKRKRGEANGAATVVESTRPPVVSAPADYRRPKTQGGER
jgi:hypothetical protein